MKFHRIFSTWSNFIVTEGCIKGRQCSIEISKPPTIYEMKTSLLILCASFAIAASTAFHEFETLDASTPLFILVQCSEKVKLHFAIADTEGKGRTAFIEDNSSCHIHRFDEGQRSLNVDRKGNPKLIFTETLYCNSFAVFVPGSTESLPIVECLA